MHSQRGLQPLDEGVMSTGDGSTSTHDIDLGGEPARLSALNSYHIVDTQPEPQFDRIVTAAAGVCDTPIALISFVDKERQWFKARHGLDVDETPREISFCAHAIRDDKLMEVTDARADPRFADTPLVTGEPHIGFYAGAPLVTPAGYRLGTVCVIDREPRQLDEVQTNVLEVLRDAVMRELELRRLKHDAADFMFKVCAWCARVQVDGEQGTWITPAEFVRQAYPVSHGMCPNCVSAEEPP